MKAMNAIRILKLLVWFLLLSFFCCTSVRQESNSLQSRLPSPPPPHSPHHHLPPHIKHTIDRLLDDNLLNAQLRGEKQPGFSALITKNFEFEKHGPRKPLYNRVGGASSIESNQLISETTKFYIGSMTKPVTAGAILKLYQDDSLDLSDPIQDYFPDFPKYQDTITKEKQSITIEHLLTHTSGLIKATYLDSTDAKGIANLTNNGLSLHQAVFEYYKSKPLLFQPGIVFNYSNYGYFLLGLIIEKVSGMTYGDYLKKNIFDIAGMQDTQVANAQRSTNNKLASGYIEDQSSFVNTDSFINESAEVLFSSGNIISTVEDLNKWYQALFRHQIISKNLLNKAHTPYLKNGDNQPEGYPFSPYGYGWIVDTSLGVDKKIISHAGQIAGFTSSAYFQPSSNTLTVLFSNFLYLEECISINGLKQKTIRIDMLNSLLFYYATSVIHRPVSINILPYSECKSKKRQRRRREIKHLKGIEGLIGFDIDLGEFIPMSEIIKEMNKTKNK